MKTINKIFQKFFFTSIFLLTFNLHAVQIANDQFTGSLNSWTGANVTYFGDFGGEMRIAQDATASKTYNFGASYAGQTATVNFLVYVETGWDSSGVEQDFFNVAANGNNLQNYTYAGAGYHNETFTAPIDANGNLILSFNANTTSAVKVAYVNYITIDASPFVQESTCPGITIPNIDGTSVSTTDNFNNVSVPANTTYYYSFTPVVAGTIQTNSVANKTYNSLFIYDGCGGATLWQDTSDGVSKSSPNITVNSGQLIVIAFERRFTTDINLDIDFTFTVTNTPPIANAGADQTVSFGVSTTHSGTASDSDGTITDYLWQNGATTLSNSASFDTSSLSIGTHTLTFTVTDNDTATASDTVIITVVGNVPPVANAGADQTVNLGDTVTLNGSGSSDSDGSIASHVWYEGGVQMGSGQILTLTNLTAGTHTFTLIVIDDDGESNSDTVVIRVNEPPIANAGPDQNITLGDTLTLDGTGSSDDFNSITYAWTESTLPLNLSGATSTTTIATAGTYTITLTVTDDNGLTDTDTLTVRVNTSPVVEDMNFTMIRDTSVTFELNATDADGDTIVSYPVFSGPAHGSLSGPESNITYTPNAGYTGIDTFTYKAYDGIDYSNLGTVTFNIFPPATAVDDDYNTTYFTPITANVLDNDFGLNIRLIESNTSTPQHGTLIMAPTGIFTYQPNDEFDGNDSFTYSIIDDFNFTSTATVTILTYPPSVDLSIVKTAPATIDGGLAMDYALNIQSLAGEQYLAARNVRVIDSLPSGVVYNGVTAPGWTCTQLGGTVTCDVANISPGYSGTILIHVFAPNTLGSSTNTATIDSETVDADTSNNQSSATTLVEGADVDMSITKTVSQASVVTSTAFSYTLTIQNTGTADASSVSITDILDPTLGFISVNDGADWVCSQGSTINCDYVANGGIFPANSGSNAIVINVRAPAQEANITNTADVASGTLEADTINNISSVNVTITNGTTQNNSILLTKYIQFNIYGDYSLIGNTNINFRGTDPNQNYNDNVNMRYVDNDNDTSTYNASSSRLTVDNAYAIKWAGLYWEGHICSANQNGNTQGNNTGCRWGNSPYNSFNDATNNINNTLGTVQFKTPNQGYVSVRANTLNTITANANTNTPIDWTYSAFADVTNLVRSGGSGVYSVADIVLTEGAVEFGNYGGWVLVTVYEDLNVTNQDVNATLHYKNISVFNGFQYIAANNTPLSVSGFLTPRSGDINASMAFFAADGDPVNGGIIRMQDRNNAFTPLSNSANPATNILNSTMTVFGTPINAGVPKTYGVDADRLDVSTFMNKAQTSTAFRFDMNRNNQDDFYSVSMFTFATDLTTPIIDAFTKSAVIIDKNGTRIAGPSQSIYPGSQLEYTINFKNIGDEVAEAVEIFDDFDNDGLTIALDINNFDATKIKLFDKQGTQINAPDCGYNVPQHRVFCKLDSVGIKDSYTMQFTVKVKDEFDVSVLNSEATNTAYAKYRNPNGNSYVERYTTPEGEKVGGKSNALTAGIFRADTPMDTTYILLDAINNLYHYNTDKNITTKIVNSPFKLQLIHKNKSDTYSRYQAWNGSRPMAVIVSLNDYSTTITPPVINPDNAQFRHNVSSTIVSNITLGRAHQNKKFKLGYLDWRDILGRAPVTAPCVTDARPSPFLNGLSACFESYALVQDVFPILDYPDVAKCYGAGVPSNKSAPCDPLAYSNYGDTPNGRISPDVYNHSYGCYHCISENGRDVYTKNSTDNFAARPDRFEFDSNDTHYPDLLRSGQEYNLSLVAKDGTDNDTLDYNTTGHTFTETHSIDPTNTIGVSLDDGNVTIGTPTSEIKDGISVDTNGDPIANIELEFDNVGELSIEIMDDEWASIDNTDGIPQDCNVTNDGIIRNDDGIPIEASTAVCGEITTMFIPHHFKVTSVLHNHRDTGGFTYFSSDLNMSAHVEVKIEAKNAQDETTSNFKKDAYEEDMTVKLNVTDWNATLLANITTFESNASTSIQDKRTDVVIDDIPTARKLGFGTGTNSEGEYTIETDAPLVQKIMFNYERTYNQPKNPLDINGSELNITVSATYNSTLAGDSTAEINGTIIATGAATFYYARIRPADDFYEKVTAAQQNTPILIDVFCDISTDLNFAKCTDAGISTSLGDFDENGLKWWLALKHDKTLNDGNVTLAVTSATGGLNKTNVNIIPANSAEDDNITVTPSNANRPVTVSIGLAATTSKWLIHNPLSPTPPMTETAPSPLEAVEFIGNSNWTGHGNTGNVVGSEANKNKNNRLGW